MKVITIYKSVAREAVESAGIIQEWIRQVYERFRDKIELASDKDLEYCVEAALRLLGFTSHVTKATTVAIASAYCVHAARLIELTGISGVLSTIRRTMPGKGSVVHKVLSVAFPRAFRKYFGNYGTGNDSEQSFIRDIISCSIEELKKLDPVFEEEYRKFGSTCNKELLQTCRALIYNALMFLNKLRDAVRDKLRIDFDFKDCKVMTEMQLISYALNIWGAPDVIIEDPANRVAVVIEWKTVTGLSQKACREIRKREKKLNVDRVQAYIYALLEAERLGYLQKDNVRSVDNLIEAVAEGKVIPFIVREHLGIYCNHWICPTSSRGRVSPWDYDRIKSELSKIILAAKYLTILLVSPYILRELDEILSEKVFEMCCLQLNTKPRIFKIYPPTLPRRVPAKCEKCKFRELCDSYIKPSDYSFESKVISQIEYQVKDKILLERERDLLPYKMLYELLYSMGKSELVKLIEGGSKITITPIFKGDINSKSYHEYTVKLSEFGNPPYLVEFSTQLMSRGYCRWRIDVFEEIEIIKDNLTLILRRNIRDWERGRVSIRMLEKRYYKEFKSKKRNTARAGREILDWLKSIEQDEPVLLSPIRPQRPVSIMVLEEKDIAPTLMPNVFARVDDVSVEGNRVKIVVRPISNSMKFSVLSFTNYIEANRELLKVEFYGNRILLKEKCLVLEANPDLTYIELRTVSILRQALTKIIGGSLPGKCIKNRDLISLLHFIAGGLLYLASKRS